MTKIALRLKERQNDQVLFRAINRTHPEVVSILPPEWDNHLTALYAGTLFQRRPKGVGYLHFNGGGSSKSNTFDSNVFLTDGKEGKGWTLANFFVKIPWSWAKFHVENMVYNSPGKPLTVEWKIV